MFNWLRNLFSKTKEVRVEDLVHTPAVNFELAMMHTQQSGVQFMWRQNAEIDSLTVQISLLMEERSRKVQERGDFITILNKQRRVLGLEEFDDNGELPSEQPADDENYALES